jgi:hydrogenase maturation protein HypF
MTGIQPIAAPSRTARRQWRLRGQVQGVGFRPFVYRLAQQHNLSGLIFNNGDGVVIEAQGQSHSLDAFDVDLRQRRPALAIIRAVECQSLPPIDGEHDFVIQPSAAQDCSQADVTVDLATCSACLAELRDSTDRRHGYGLINCTDCGPRYSIIANIPYDRPNTTMASFVMCPACQAEYDNPATRRFHAQPTACPQCGPQLALVSNTGKPIAGPPIATAARQLAAGQILAIKGMGGFHLAVRADDVGAVARLRKLKQRDHKPLALMAFDLASAEQLVHLSDAAKALMQSAACPIVLAPRKAEAPVAPAVAPESHRLGVMLPYTPVHHLLMAELRALGCHSALVMTSGNLSDEPIATDNDQAQSRLGAMCDAFLWHDRRIQRCVDDSVVIDMGEDDVLPLRRSRGHAPQSVRLPVSDGSMGLCVGGELKNTVAVVRGGSAVLSQHLGDLTHPLAYEHFRQAVDDLQKLFSVQPAWIAHDLHPLYQSHVYARQLSAATGARLVGIQHHHAHAAALMAEHGLRQPILALVCDGVGYGSDGTSWGGELMVADLTHYQRLCHLRPLRLPGGDAAAKDTRRCGLALLQQAMPQNFAEHPATAKLVPDENERPVLVHMLRTGLNCAVSSGAGRVFDGVAALLGLCQHNQCEARAAMALEAAASTWNGSAGSCPAPLCHEGLVDLSPLVIHLVQQSGQVPAAQLAALFHEQFALAWEIAILQAVQKTGVRTVGLSGGVFCNQILTTRLSQRLQERGLRVLRHRLVPPNDGGIALGQATIAAAMIANAKAGA